MPIRTSETKRFGDFSTSPLVSTKGICIFSHTSAFPPSVSPFPRGFLVDSVNFPKPPESQRNRAGGKTMGVIVRCLDPHLCREMLAPWGKLENPDFEPGLLVFWCTDSNIQKNNLLKHRISAGKTKIKNYKKEILRSPGSTLRAGQGSPPLLAVFQTANISKASSI